jgi:hypothetical protein
MGMNNHTGTSGNFAMHDSNGTNDGGAGTLNHDGTTDGTGSGANGGTNTSH